MKIPSLTIPRFPSKSKNQLDYRLVTREYLQLIRRSCPVLSNKKLSLLKGPLGIGYLQVAFFCY